MSSKFLPGLTGLALVLGCLCAQAAPVVGDPALIRYSGANELIQSGNYVVDFIVGRPVPTEAGPHAISVAAPARDDTSARYAEDNASLTFIVASLIAFGGACALLFGNSGGKRRESHSPAGLVEALFEMHDADVRNLDSMVHGFSRR